LRRVVTDLGGFVASTLSEIDFINIPTTLLSMVDASVGGVDLEFEKSNRCFNLPNIK
jgi:3-dehydroquinate synthase